MRSVDKARVVVDCHNSLTRRSLEWIRLSKKQGQVRKKINSAVLIGQGTYLCILVQRSKTVPAHVHIPNYVNTFILILEFHEPKKSGNLKEDQNNTWFQGKHDGLVLPTCWNKKMKETVKFSPRHGCWTRWGCKCNPAPERCGCDETRLGNAARIRTPNNSRFPWFIFLFMFSSKRS